MIRAPHIPADHPDRGIACQEALSAYFNWLADTARDAGWSDDEVAAALAMLAECEFMSVEANRQLMKELAAL